MTAPLNLTVNGEPRRTAAAHHRRAGARARPQAREGRGRAQRHDRRRARRSARWRWPTATCSRSCISSAAAMRADDDTWTVAGRTFRSRLIVGTGKYKDFAQNAAALEASGAEIVTVAVRRVNVSRSHGADADRLHRSRARSPTCPTPPAASPPTRRSARCGWRARRAAGTWSSSRCWARRARSIPTCARR